MSRSIDPAGETDHRAAAPAPGDPRTAVLLDREPERLVALASALERVGIATLATETTFAGASAVIARHAPSVVVLDVGLRDDGTSSLELVARLRRAHGDLKLVCLREADDRTALDRVFAAGADAVFLRRSASPELAQVVSRLLRDDALFVPVRGWIPDVGAGAASGPAVLLGRRTEARLARPGERGGVTA